MLERESKLIFDTIILLTVKYNINIKEMKYKMLNEIEKDIYYLVGQNIKKQRKLKGLTQKKLAEITYYSYEFIRKIESKSACRNTFSLDTVDKIAKALDINIKILFEPLDDSKVS